MSISDDRLREFMSLYQGECGEALSFEEARSVASRLVQLYALLIGPASAEKGIREYGEGGDPSQRGSS